VVFLALALPVPTLKPVLPWLLTLLGQGDLSGALDPESSRCRGRMLLEDVLPTGISAKKRNGGFAGFSH